MGRNWTVLGSRGHKDRHASVAAVYYLRLRASLEVSRCRAHAPRALALRGLPAISQIVGQRPLPILTSPVRWPKTWRFRPHHTLRLKLVDLVVWRGNFPSAVVRRACNGVAGQVPLT